MNKSVPLIVQDVEPVQLQAGTQGGIELIPGDAFIVGQYDPYQGETEFTPGPDEQVVSTRGKVLMSDIVINPIPQQYGLITYNGNVITVS
jgi:hypothetical protein